MAENYKYVYEQMKKIVEKYQDEIVPGLQKLVDSRVEVVLCKECKHRFDDTNCPMCFEEIYTYDDDGYGDTDYITHDRTIDGGFCHLGERRADDAGV